LDRSLAHRPDTVVYSEYRNSAAGVRLRAGLREAGPEHAGWPSSEGGNGVPIASGLRFVSVCDPFGLQASEYPDAVLLAKFDTLDLFGVRPRNVTTSAVHEQRAPETSTPDAMRRTSKSTFAPAARSMRSALRTYTRSWSGIGPRPGCTNTQTGSSTVGNRSGATLRTSGEAAGESIKRSCPSRCCSQCGRPNTIIRFAKLRLTDHSALIVDIDEPHGRT
jgi:hypothetical protein